MPVVVVATLTVKPESVDTVRDILTRAVEEVHDEPGCQVYSLHQSGETFVFVEQWADAEALKVAHLLHGVARGRSQAAGRVEPRRRTLH